MYSLKCTPNTHLLLVLLFLEPSPCQSLLSGDNAAKVSHNEPAKISHDGAFKVAHDEAAKVSYDEPGKHSENETENVAYDEAVTLVYDEPAKRYSRPDDLIWWVTETVMSDPVAEMNKDLSREKKV
ncbi:uncharacterized protein Bfra_002996 [Botrytis fragariae]|uniref:Uncharacterized protein n=1 Tax=Botrytis fragariae TaxID=1964551 RepID=A0A8H6AZY0_9HELO|nr:uncharacterized protein Bfra_002996 [Botrytis fragariae]KAF5876590.1 hypothetical protein Bfra_002996 [Botrytis fragariae]